MKIKKNNKKKEQILLILAIILKKFFSDNFKNIKIRIKIIKKILILRHYKYNLNNPFKKLKMLFLANQKLINYLLKCFHH